MKKILLIFALLTLLFVASCQTVQGIGGDIQWMGEKGAEVLGGDDTYDDTYSSAY